MRVCNEKLDCAFTVGNVKRADLLVVSPKGVDFRVECKNVGKLRDSWLVGPVKPSDSLFFIFAYSQLEEPYEKPRHWIVSSKKVAELYKKYLAGDSTRKGKKMNVRYKQLGEESNWDILPK